jgi:hypothetical protein
LSKIHSILPKFKGEVLEGSMVAVAYTMGTYMDKDDVHNLSPNIQWVAVLGEAAKKS